MATFSSGEGPLSVQCSYPGTRSGTNIGGAPAWITLDPIGRGQLLPPSPSNPPSAPATETPAMRNLTASLSSYTSLSDFPLAARLVLAVFLISVGLGYFSALVNLHFQQASAGEGLPTKDDVVNS